ncbi:MAG: SusC/RagA family TonB-linked outer membrane protein [Bacteroidia bacterium]|nr:SusC/RagA family TonB-linked outer membrane protein [Bacteroidia bacterium]
MRRSLLLLLLMTAFASQMWAQNQVSGKVSSSEDGSALSGVSVVLVGTTKGVLTDGQGSYRLEVPANSTLRFSYVGFADQEVEVGNRSVIDIVLQVSDVTLDEVVVTALGISRDKKALGYSVTEVGGENFTQARENNLANALSGRIAGVNVSRVASGPSGSSRVIIRGNKSLQGNNQPLYVVDGIPMDNSGFGQAGLWGGRDEGDGMSSINPDDIESITVLKGASAAALYGSRAANGVINIVTKKGTSRKGIGIEINSNYVFETVNDQSDLQQKYGSGEYVGPLPNGVSTRPGTLAQAYDWGDDSWGPALDGSQVIQFDGVSRPYSAVTDNWKNYFETGSALTNSVSFTGGSATQNFRLSVSDLRNTSIIPNAGFDRTNISLSTNAKFGNKITVVGKVMYSNEYTKNRPYLSDSPANGIQAIWRTPPNVSVLDYYGDPEKPGAIPPGTDPATLLVWQKSVGEEFQQAANNWGQNPYWTAYQFREDDERDRMLSSGQIRYDITSFLYIQGRVGMDWYTRRDHNLVPQGTGYQRGGSISEGEDRVQEINMEWLLGFDKAFNKLNINAFVGGNRMRRFNERISANGNNFNVPFFQAINNAQIRNFGYGFSESGINSLFGSAELSYNGFLYLTGTFRDDWFSVLHAGNSGKPVNILYPSVSASFIFTDAVNGLPNWLSFGKVRASWAQVGNVTIGPYSTINTYSLKQSHLGYTLASFSSAGGNNGSIPNPDILPLTSTEIEVGIDLRFFDNRLGLDATYYSQKTTDDILNASISRASGFGSTLVNLGQLRNRGLEVLLTVTPVRGDFTWDISFNIAKNSNIVDSLIEGNTELTLEEPRTRNVFIKHIVGHPFGMITGRVQRLSPDGQPIFFSDGRPVGSLAYEIIGNGIADWTGGVNNSFTFKDFNLAFLVDFKIGGDIYSGTNNRLTGWGLHQQSLIGREGEEPLTVSGVTQVGTNSSGQPIYEPFEKTLTPHEARQYWGSVGGEANAVTTMFLYDGSFAKLRQLTFGYSFPRSLLSKTPIQNLSLSFVGRNLAVLFKNIENVDPESGYSNTNSQGLDYFGMPATRSYGFNLRIGF